MIRRIAPGWGFAPAVDCTPFIATVSDVALSFFVQFFSKMPWVAWLTYLFPSDAGRLPDCWLDTLTKVVSEKLRNFLNAGCGN
ncbi:hypothetical protein [Pseudomonas sp. PIC25]|uniref:hypothetical protein n=1 Tax=Pseudomonas sp. PIC25 TaxID=1958773 RepID=UPI00117B3093|nr:hypothetical protein [Pseudomonas sp. PIC25]